MKTFARSGPKGDPIETPSIFFNILSLNVNAVFEHASFNTAYKKKNLSQKNLTNAIKERNNDIRNLSAEHDTNKTRLKK